MERSILAHLVNHSATQCGSYARNTMQRTLTAAMSVLRASLSSSTLGELKERLKVYLTVEQILGTRISTALKEPVVFRRYIQKDSI